MEGKRSWGLSAVLVGVIVVLVIIIAAGAFTIVKMRNQKEKPTQAVKKIGMEAGIVTNDEDVSEMEVNESFEFTTLYHREIYITDGRNATCYIGNSAQNYYEDMYVQIYLNGENDLPEEEIYLSQIIPRGSHIESFVANRDLEPGDYRGTLIHSNVDEKGELVGDTPVIVEIHVAK